MARIPVMYEYTQYTHAPFATFLDKTFRKPYSMLLFVLSHLCCLPLAFGFAAIGGVKDSPAKTVTNLFCLVFGLMPFVLPVILSALWKKKAWGDAIAHLERGCRDLPEVKRICKKSLYKLLAAFLAPWLILAVCAGIAAVRPGIYHSRMARAFSQEDHTSPGGNKCVIYMADEGRYSHDLLPHSITAYTPRQAGYILRVEKQETYLYDTVTYNPKTFDRVNAGVYRMDYVIHWIACATGEVVRTEIHEGTIPHKSSEFRDGSFYGEYPEGLFFERDLEETWNTLQGAQS